MAACVTPVNADSAIIYSTGEALEGECMQFRLLYSGQLLGASRNSPRASHKHDIRRTFHPQLKRLWETNSGLRTLCVEHSGPFLMKHQSDTALMESIRTEFTSYEESQEWRRRLGLRYFADNWDRGGSGFIPLVTEDIAVRCAIDILFLRPEKPGVLIQSGDLDNRIKTIFDALRLPNNADECGGDLPSGDENPMYCLLEDDKLISDVRVNADQLLYLPNATEMDKNDVFLVVDVKVQPIFPNKWSALFS